MGTMKHKEYKVQEISFSLIVTSDSIVKGISEDKITPLVRNSIKKAGFQLSTSSIISNDKEQIKKLVKAFLQKNDVVIVTGGTGLSSKDLSIKALKELGFDEIKGFGELFRSLSFSQVGAYAWLSNASAFIANEKGMRKIVFVLPGSPEAVELALNKLILPVIAHALWELRR